MSGSAYVGDVMSELLFYQNGSNCSDLIRGCILDYNHKLCALALHLFKSRFKLVLRYAADDGKLFKYFEEVCNKSFSSRR